MENLYAIYSYQLVKTNDEGDNSGDWYTLGGQRLNAKPNKQGVYVRDGRKVVVK